MMEVDVIKMEWLMNTTYALRTPDGNAILVIPKREDERPMLYDLFVREGSRRKGEGAALLHKAEDICRSIGKRELALEWDRRESKQFVFNWYARQGFEEKEFDNYRALLVKALD